MPSGRPVSLYITVSIPPPPSFQVVLYLYEQLPDLLKPLRHIRIENIYIEKRNCRLGGHENTLLGYSKRFDQECHRQHCTDDIDVIMFGGCGVSVSHDMFCGCVVYYM